MNTMKLLLGATFGLLVIALAYSFSIMGNGGSHTSEIAKLQEDSKRISQALEELRSTAHSSFTAPAYQPPATQPVLQPAEQEEITQLKAQVEQLKAIAEENTATPEEDRALAREERKQIERINFIKNALLKATVSEWSSDGNFAVIEIKQLNLVQPGSLLTVRRGDGVLGRLEVQYIADGKNAIANPIQGSFPKGSSLEVGDELIEPPVY